MEDFLKSVGALYDETRVALLAFLDRHGPLCVCDLEASFGMTQSRLSRHLKILKEAGFLRAERCGRWTHYAIRSPLDRFRSEVLEEIRSLSLELPSPKKRSGECRK
ncbi:ArsR/SmtB family transcription factor [Hydrogenimonas sp.]